jgi:hypothetical protein
MCTDNVLFIFRFSGSGCEVCIDDVFIGLSKFARFMNNNSFLIITDFQDMNKFNAISSLYKDKYSFINIVNRNNLYINEKDEILPPVFFILSNGELRPKNIFFYFKELPELNKKYFEFITSNYLIDE